jgi:hypothetical protein
MQWWKWVGLAGLAGVAASGVLVARDERQRRAYTPEQVRARLHQRAGQPLPPLPPPRDGTLAMTATPDHATHDAHTHDHGADCGHDAVTHGDHVDYVHDGHRHRAHDDHYDECAQ